MSSVRLCAFSSAALYDTHTPKEASALDWKYEDVSKITVFSLKSYCFYAEMICGKFIFSNVERRTNMSELIYSL